MSVSGLDKQSFHLCCKLLLQDSDRLSDGWSWEEVQDLDKEEGFLRKTALRSVTIDSSWDWSLDREVSCQDDQKEEFVAVADITVGDGDGDEDEELCSVSAGNSQVLQYEYHILFSCSYGTPVLYFRVFTVEGRSLSLEEVWSSAHPNFRLRLKNSPLNTITLQEHPLLGQPFFMLHPCKTEEFMRPVLQAAKDQNRPVNYILSWLSMVGPLVGLEVPLKYCTLLQPNSLLGCTKTD